MKTLATATFLAALFTLTAQNKPALPPAEAAAKATVEKSPRHAEYVDITIADGKPPMKAYVVYPEVKDKAPVVIVIQEIYGLSDWLKGVTDQLAADGFIAIAPDLLSGPMGPGTDALGDRSKVTQAVRSLEQKDVFAALDATAAYGTKLPASNGKTATVGYCWGGAMSFLYAAHNPNLAAAVVYYGGNPKDPAIISKIKAPVAGFYGQDDARVNATIPDAQKAMKDAGKTYAVHTYDGAGHGFLRQQDGRNGANLKASEQAWPETVKFLKENAK